MENRRASLWFLLCLVMFTSSALAESTAARQFAITNWNLINKDQIKNKKSYWVQVCNEKTEDSQRDNCVNKIVDMILYHEMVCLMELDVTTKSWSDEVKGQFDTCRSAKLEDYNIFTAMLQKYSVVYQEQAYGCMVKSDSYRDTIDFPVHENLKSDNPFPRLNHEKAITCLNAIK